MGRQGVKHVIVFNVPEDVAEAECVEMARRAREVLTQVPGVRSVSFGIAVSPRPAYRYLLIVDFRDESVIDLYRDHPLHVRFADEVFRPLAVHRITTDYRMVFEADEWASSGFCPRCTAEVAGAASE